MLDSTNGAPKHYRAVLLDNSSIEWDGGEPSMEEIINAGLEWAVMHGENKTVILHLPQVKFVEVT